MAPSADLIWFSIAEHFGPNFLFEVQDHNTEPQKTLNARILNLANRNNIRLIFGCDSHFIYPAQAAERDNYLLSKKIEYEDETGWYMDYPSGDEVVKRFKMQGVLTPAQIAKALDNTGILLDVEEYNNPCFTHDVKMPSFYPELSQDEKNQKFWNLIWEKWEEEKPKIPQKMWAHYEEEIKKELDIVITTHHADYFLLDYEIVKLGKKKGGVVANFGRGSVYRSTLTNC